MQDNNSNINTDKSMSFNAFYRESRPECFSDTIVRYDVPLTEELFCQQMELLSTNKMHSAFENFIVSVAKRVITPNIKPQTGPDGGGDGKVDAETYEVSDDISSKWYSCEETASSKEYWAFAISCKKNWKTKVSTDVEKITNTHRNYSKVLFFTNQYVKSSTRAEIEKNLSKTYSIKVEIYDRSCLIKWVFNDKCIDIALDTLGFSDIYKQKTVIVGPNDSIREKRLGEIEQSILRRIVGLDTEYIKELQEACILSRELEKPRKEVEGRFLRALRECEGHGSKQQMYNIVYDHAWTCFFWYEDFEATYNDFLTLKSYVDEHCNIERVEKLTNILTILDNASKAGFIKVELITHELQYIKDLAEKLKYNSDRQSSAVFLNIYILEQRLIDHKLNGQSIDDDILALKPLLIESASHLEISFETNYKVFNMLSQYMEDNALFDRLIDDLVEIIEKKRTRAEAAKLRLSRAENNIRKNNWKGAVKHLGFCVYAFEQEECLVELIRSSSYLGIALSNLGLYYSARSFLLKSASLLIQDFYHSGNIDHLLITIVQELCSIELKLGRLIMYLNWNELLSVISQNSQFDEEDRYKTFCQMNDAAWAFRFAESDLRNPSIAFLPDILERQGLILSSEYLKYNLGYSENVDEACISALEEINSSLHERLEPNQFYDKINISNEGRAYAKTTVNNFTITVSYDNDIHIQYIAELFLACIESFMATAEMFDIIPVDNQISVKAIKTYNHSDFVFKEHTNTYELFLNSSDLNDQMQWELIVKFLVLVLTRNAVTKESIESIIESKHNSERLMDRVSVLQRTETALKNVLGQNYKYRLEDWCRETDNVYDNKNTNDTKDEKIFTNEQQSTLISHNINSDMHLWNDAGWNGCGFVHDIYGTTPPIFGMAFSNFEKGKTIVSEWKTDIKVKIYIVKGIDLEHPTWYRVCIAPVVVQEKATSSRYFFTFCRKHMMTPQTSDNLYRFESQYKKFGGCWLMAFQIKEDNSIVMPQSTNEAFKFTDVEFRDAHLISTADPARIALECNDNPFIPDDFKENPPVINVLENLKKSKC